MPPPSWSESFSIGHDKLDLHHQELVETLASLQGRLENRECLDLILADYDLWLDAFSRHAMIEEKMMERLTTPAGIAHRAAHEAEHAQFLHHAALLRARLAVEHQTEPALEAMGLLMIKFDLLQRDFEMIGLMLREGLSMETEPA